MTKRKSGGTFVERELYESKAFLSLKGAAPQVLILIFGKRQFQKHGRKGKEKRVCVNCKSINFTYVEAGRLGISKPRLSRAFDELLAKGFLNIQHKGGGYQKDKSVYGISDNWRFWQPGRVFEKRENDPVQRGFCKPNRLIATN